MRMNSQRRSYSDERSRFKVIIYVADHIHVIWHSTAIPVGQKRDSQ
jgi:hypothetical protein